MKPPDVPPEVLALQARLLERREQYHAAERAREEVFMRSVSTSADVAAKLRARLDAAVAARAAEVSRRRATFRCITNPDPIAREEGPYDAIAEVAPAAPGDQLCELPGFTAAVALARLLRPDLSRRDLARAGRTRRPSWSRSNTVADPRAVIEAASVPTTSTRRREA